MTPGLALWCLPVLPNVSFDSFSIICNAHIIYIINMYTCAHMTPIHMYTFMPFLTSKDSLVLLLVKEDYIWNIDRFGNDENRTLGRVL